MEINERIKQRRKELGMSAEQVAEAIGVSPATIYRYESSDIKNMRAERLKPIADALHTTPEWLMGWSTAVDPIPPGFEPLPATEQVPLVGRIACGEPILAEENIECMVSVPLEWNASFALTCVGDSMAPSIKDGDIVAIRKQPTVEQGQIAAVRIDDEATLKHVYIYPDYIELRPENTAYESIIKIGEAINDICIEGLAVGLCREIQK